jgi:hypothetical protein
VILVEQGEVPRVLTDSEFEFEPVLVCLLVPLLEGSTMKKEVICLIGFGLVGG